ncbi:Uma2 family endonuclease [Vitiosangium sp. GDMCC 1.1324]|uniref:Uma2 family endonuclease n=1 Tax=Vitiosangium sp. (strain GDMCC 1.1324) TaxID=2138576 RepID=UPI000D342996|nr:Uma2 family endonuclease [Vitiosangium sp. GDMCC 1.1324]PTL85127.1 hypothetical protein DAT35_06925 [Vitiosangium sp. GDMCC 1.1324]
MGKRPATYADLEELPPNMVGEIIDGELYASPRPAMPHTKITTELATELLGPFHRGRGGPGGWRIFIEPELHLHGNVLVPDFGGWRRERLPKALKGAAVAVAPDWVCEILSPSTEARDRANKLPTYASEGVRHVWLIDPELHTLEVFRLEGAHYVLLATYIGDARVRAEPFEALELELNALWGE